MSPQKILITGGAGFIGSQTVELLLRQGNQIVVLDNLFSGNLSNLNLANPNLEFIEGDVLEYPLVEDLLRNCDAVLHLAAVASVPHSIENPIYSFQVNTQGFLHVLEAVRKAERPIRLVYASSAAVYGDLSDLPCRDDVPFTGIPLSPYALQKIHNENYASLYARIHGIKSLALRYFNVYGPNQDPSSPYSGVISRFLNHYKNNNELTIFGDGDQCRDFIHISDVAIANALALQSDFTGFLNIATGEQETILNLIKYIEAVGGRLAKLRFEPRRIGDIKSSYAAIKRAHEHLGFKYSIALKDGVKEMMG